MIERPGFFQLSEKKKHFFLLWKRFFFCPIIQGKTVNLGRLFHRLGLYVYETIEQLLISVKLNDIYFATINWYSKCKTLIRERYIFRSRPEPTCGPTMCIKLSIKCKTIRLNDFYFSHSHTSGVSTCIQS